MPGCIFQVHICAAPLRAHHVTAQTHAQFAPLDAWIDAHRTDLCALLGDAPHRRILFGEWVRAKHSIAYHRLPDCTCSGASSRH